MTRVHVAVDAHNLARDDRGIGRYARAVLSRAQHDARFRWTFVVRDLFPRRTAVARAIGESDARVARRVPLDADVVWFPWNGTFLRTAVPSVATIHDAAPFAFPAAGARRRATEQNPFLTTAATARRILVQSRFTAGEVERRLGVDAARVVVTPLAADPAFCPGPIDALPSDLRGKRYVLHVGAHDERKNSATLIAAFARAFPGGDVTLVFTRRPPELPPDARVVDAPDDVTLVALYRGAALVAVPSTYEGFGLPLLEAMACGTAARRRARRRAARGRRRRGGMGRRRARRRRLERHAAPAAGRRRRAGVAGRTRPDARRDVLVGSLHRADAGGARSGGGRSVKALLVVRPDAPAKPGGDLVHAERTATALRALGAEVDLVPTDAPDPRGYDVAHVFGVFEPALARKQIDAVRAHGTPLALSPIWLDLRAFFATAPRRRARAGGPRRRRGRAATGAAAPHRSAPAVAGQHRAQRRPASRGAARADRGRRRRAAGQRGRGVPLRRAAAPVERAVRRRAAGRRRRGIHRRAPARAGGRAVRRPHRAQEKPGGVAVRPARRRRRGHAGRRSLRPALPVAVPALGDETNAVRRARRASGARAHDVRRGGARAPLVAGKSRVSRRSKRRRPARGSSPATAAASASTSARTSTTPIPPTPPRSAPPWCARSNAGPRERGDALERRLGAYTWQRTGKATLDAYARATAARG